MLRKMFTFSEPGVFLGIALALTLVQVALFFFVPGCFK